MSKVFTYDIESIRDSMYECRIVRSDGKTFPCVSLMEARALIAHIEAGTPQGKGITWISPKPKQILIVKQIAESVWTISLADLGPYQEICEHRVEVGRQYNEIDAFDLADDLSDDLDIAWFLED